VLIAQGPLRISLFGGGSDFPAFLINNDGAVLSLAIDRRVFIVGHPFTHREGVVLKYSRYEDVADAAQLEHPIARVILDRYGVGDIDIAVMSDVPAGTGLGSFSSFTVAFLAFTRHLCGLTSTAADLAAEACEIEIDILREPIGYQDQWASAVGGVNIIRFTASDVHVESVDMRPPDVQSLEQNLYLVPVGSPRSASEVLTRQKAELNAGSRGEQITRRMVGLVDQGREALVSALDDLGPLLNEAWQSKREVTQGISNHEIDRIYNQGISAGATGGKLLGAGGSRYLAFYVP